MNDRAVRLRLTVALVVVLAAALIVDRTTSTATPPVPRITAAPAALLARNDVRSAAWYCPLASPVSAIGAHDAVFIANTSSSDVTVEISGLGSGRRRAVRRVQVTGGHSLTFAAHELAGLHGDAVLVEPFGPGIVVEHRVALTAAPAVAPCATTLHATWYFPALTTRRGAKSVVALFNPLARTDVVVDVTLYTPSGQRQPSALQGLEVARRSRVVVNANSYADREPVLALSVRARAGGRIAAEAAVSIGPAVAVSLGAPQPSGQYWFASGAAGAPRTLFALNVGDTATDVGVQIVPVGSQQTVPITVHVNAGSVVAVDLAKLAGPRDYSVMIGAPANADIVVGDLEQRRLSKPPGAPSLSSAVGVAAPALHWALAVGLVGSFDAETLDVLDPTAAIAHVTVRSVDGHTQTATVQPGDRVAMRLPAGTTGPIVIESDRPVIVERVLHQPRPAGNTRTTAVPAP